jgi:hypothetical protein
MRTAQPASTGEFTELCSTFWHPMCVIACAAARRLTRWSARMGYRIFKDSHGTEWQTWDVVPQLGERRTTDRRRQTVALTHSDRRSPTDRRVVSGTRSVLTAGLDAGWLCFETTDEKRRLTPIPSDWLRCAVPQLEQYCLDAKPARLRTPAVQLLKTIQ